MIRNLVGVSLFGLLVASTGALAAVIHVPDDQPTIQDGINASVSGDTVLVAPGTYTGPGNTNLSFGGRQITLESEGGPETCTIDCAGGSQPGIYPTSSGALVRGFTVTGSSGDGVECYGDLALKGLHHHRPWWRRRGVLGRPDTGKLRHHRQWRRGRSRRREFRRHPHRLHSQ